MFPGWQDYNHTHTDLLVEVKWMLSHIRLSRGSGQTSKFSSFQDFKPFRNPDLALDLLILGLI
jgi:hypothetical protein